MPGVIQWLFVLPTTVRRRPCGTFSRGQIVCVAVFGGRTQPTDRRGTITESPTDLCGSGILPFDSGDGAPAFVCVPSLRIGPLRCSPRGGPDRVAACDGLDGAGTLAIMKGAPMDLGASIRKRIRRGRRFVVDGRRSEVAVGQDEARSAIAESNWRQGSSRTLLGPPPPL